MSTYTKEFTKERLIEKLQHRISVASGFPESEKAQIDLELARIALASLEAEPVAWLLSGGGAKNHVSFDSGNAYADPLREVTPLYTAPPATVSVHDEDLLHMAASAIEDLLDHCDPNTDYYSGVWADVPDKLRRAAMLQGAEPVMTAYKLPDDFDFDRFNDVTWLEAVACYPNMHSLKASTIAMVALELNRKLFDGNSPVIPDGLRLALSNAGIAAPESDEMLAATCEKYIQALVTWVKDRKPFRSAVIPDGWVACSERMPEDDEFVYIWPRPDLGVELHVGQYCECHPKGDGWYAQVYEQNYGIEWCPITVTHWMPLPAAPQREVK